MPELPDVEVFKNYLDKNALKKKIDRVEVKDKRVLSISARALADKVTGHQLKSAKRIGKHLLVNDTTDEWLTIHFGMTGYLERRKEGDPHKYAAVTFHFNNDEELDYISKRKLGKIGLADSLEAFANEKGLGPDALEIHWEVFRDRIREKDGKLKARLMDQSLLAGIGNVYSDEILYQEKLHPEKQVKNLDDKQLRSLFNTMRRVLQVAIRHGANPGNLPGSYLTANRKTGVSCPNCGGRIRKIKSAGRSAYICEQCQG